MYKDKYHFFIDIHNENESQNDCLQPTFAYILYNSPKLISSTYADVQFPGQDERKPERACSMHMLRE